MSDAAELFDIEQRIYDNIRTNVRLLRAARRIPSRALFVPLGLSRTVFSARVNGTSRFTAPEVLKLAKLLETTVEQLCDDPPNELLRPGDAGTRSVHAYLEALAEEARSRCFTLLPGQDDDPHPPPAFTIRRLQLVP